ncbi:DNA-binding transcriptional regulator, LysR family [Roseivivax halotolerans]|uniref:DNA-binding transcriptional regulator, LysR family n=1 Tax=Roseivivax halotolerans TaxID=93684 RepID=A0A1I5ZSF6_9RHOB|nr:LysR substrate-binding domain-containing protein [Roseivivax halotolerans]SFQ59350.1 DNA-binding transcriptional regulator, LysR family [Roseivivax halotolerans]
MFDVSDLRFLTALSAAPSLAAAARGLGVTPPAVSQRLALLEDRLRLRLIERGRGQLRLTAEGAYLVDRAKDILDDVESLADEMAARAGRIEGPLHVIAPFGFGRLRVAPVLARFGDENQELRPMLSLSEDPVGAMNDGLWDLLVHVGRLPDLRTTQRKLAPNRRLLVASAGYARRFGLPQRPEDVAAHRVGVVRENRADATLWPLTGPEGIEMNLRVQPVYGCNDGEVLRAWALEGFGIVERSEWSISADLRAGRLVRVLPDWSLPDADIVALLNPRAVRSLRIDKFVERLASEISAPPMA